MLDKNNKTLTHLTLGAYLARAHSWDSAFGSPTIQNLTHLELVDTRISHVILARIAHAHNLISLTLHGTLDAPTEAAAIFGANHLPPDPDAGWEGASASMTGAQMHVLLPYLEAFRFTLVGHDNDLSLFGAVVHFLRARPRMRRLDLGACPWELVRGLLPELPGLRALRVRIESLTSLAVDALVRGLPREMQAIHLACASSDRLMVRAPLPSLPPLLLIRGSATTARVRTCVFTLRSSQHAPLARLVVPPPAADPHDGAAGLHGRVSRTRVRRRAGRAEP